MDWESEREVHKKDSVFGEVEESGHRDVEWDGDWDREEIL